jgi:hypothetical protein
MKASSVELELNLELSEEEITRLGRGERLEAILNFSFFDSNKEKEIPLSLRYVRGFNRQIEVEQTPPNSYFGDAKLIELTISDFLYSSLLEQGICGDRFYGAVGKVVISRQINKSKHL